MISAPEQAQLHDATSEHEELARQELVEEDLLVEEISIDGMCGVY
ncbi:MAG: mycofactocin precursor [Acidimicrobiales bacterium]|nr:mycofactocin precursor [Acidimicrobiales bacterium]